MNSAMIKELQAELAEVKQELACFDKNNYETDELAQEELERLEEMKAELTATLRIRAN